MKVSEVWCMDVLIVQDGNTERRNARAKKKSQKVVEPQLVVSKARSRGHRRKYVKVCVSRKSNVQKSR